MNDIKITEEELEWLENIHKDLDHNLPSTTINSGIINVLHKYPENFIDNQEHFRWHHSWILSEHKRNKSQTIPTQVKNVQLNGGSNYHMFTGITMFTYIRPVKFNVKIKNVSKSPSKGFGLVVIKIPKKTSLDHSIHDTTYNKTHKNKISQTPLKH